MVKPILCSAFHRKHCNFIQLYTHETRSTNCIANNVPGGESSCDRHQVMWELWDDNLQVVHPPQGRIFRSCRGEYLITILYASVNIVWILPRVSGVVTLAYNSHTSSETSQKYPQRHCTATSGGQGMEPKLESMKETKEFRTISLFPVFIENELIWKCDGSVHSP